MTKTIGVVLRPGASEALEDVQRIQQLLPDATLLVERDGHHAVRDIPARVTPVTPEQFEERCDMMVVLGGDGTLIHAASLLRNKVVPILGVNLGHIGFLTDVTREELNDVLNSALEGKLPYSDRMRLDVELWQDGEITMRERILNDAVLGPQALARIATYELRLNGELITSVRGDGMIVSTPTGSTAYAMAAGGSILSPDLEAVLIVPICPHQLTQRPLVLVPTGELELRLQSDSVVHATCDGRAGMEFRHGDQMIIRRAPVPARILTVPWRDYFRTLRTKLGWGNS